MATNYVQEGKILYLPTVTGAKSGEPYVVGSYMPCVLLTDAGTDPFMATVQTEGVFKLSCRAHDGSGNSAISVGDSLFWTDKDTALDKDSSEDFFGIALEAVDAGATATINVLLVPKTSVPDSVDTADIEAGAVTAVKLAADAVETVKILDANVTYAKLAADVTKHLTSNALTGVHDTKMEPNTSGYYMLATASGEGAFTLGDPAFEGQQITIKLQDKATDDLVITADSDLDDAGNDIVTLDTEGESVTLVGYDSDDSGTLQWRVIGVYGTIALSSA